MNKNYIQNNKFEVICNNQATMLFKDNIDKIYVLNKIEEKIWSLFGNSIKLEDAYEQFINSDIDVNITKEDFSEFIEQLISNKIIIEC